MYKREFAFLENTLKTAYARFADGELNVSEKAEFDIVTNIDLAIERYFREELAKNFPGDLVLGEEYSSEITLQNRTWILDPIDGTFNFSVGSQLFGLQAALWDCGDLVVSAIYLPKLGEYYHAEKNQGAFLNGEKIHVSSRLPKNAILSFGDLPHARRMDTEDELVMIRKAQDTVAKIRMFGAASIDFTQLASGKSEGTILFTRNKWDIAPGLLLSKEAGAVCYGVDGGIYNFDCRGIVALNKKELFDLIHLDGGNL